jgi:hypothetical protein
MPIDVFNRGKVASIDDKDHVVPAIRHGGRVYPGKRGKTHEDIQRHPDLRDEQLSWKAFGFYNRKTQTFHPKYDSEGESYLDSTDLMTPMQRVHNFGVESTSAQAVRSLVRELIETGIN